MKYSAPVHQLGVGFAIFALQSSTIVNARALALANGSWGGDPAAAVGSVLANCGAKPAYGAGSGMIPFCVVKQAPARVNRIADNPARTVNLPDGMGSIGSAAADAVGLATHTTAVLSSPTHSIAAAYWAKEDCKRLKVIEKDRNVGARDAITWALDQFAITTHNIWTAAKWNRDSVPANSAKPEITVSMVVSEVQGALAGTFPTGTTNIGLTISRFHVVSVGQRRQPLAALPLLADKVASRGVARPWRQPAARAPS